MSAFNAIFKIRFMLGLQYRMAAIAGIVTQLFFGFIFVMVFSAFYESGSSSLAFTYTQAVTYLWLGQGLLSLLPWNGDREIQGMIRNGDMAYEFARPLDLYNYWFSRILAGRLAPTLLKSFPMFIVTGLMLRNPYRLSGPQSGQAFLLFMVSMTGAVLLGCAISNIITISILFTLGDGLDRFFPAIVTLFSGMIIPLPLFPDWLQPLIRFLPFGDLVDTPYKYYLGIYRYHHLPYTLLHQLAWLIGFVLLGRFMIDQARKRIVVQGG